MANNEDSKKMLTLIRNKISSPEVQKMSDQEIMAKVRSIQVFDLWKYMGYAFDDLPQFESIMKGILL